MDREGSGDIITGSRCQNRRVAAANIRRAAKYTLAAAHSLLEELCKRELCIDSFLSQRDLQKRGVILL